MLPILVLVVFLPVCRTFSWVHAPKWQGNDPAMPTEVNDGIPPAEIAAILQGSGSLEAYTRRPDCFRRAASLIRTRCGDLETDENGRVKAALSLTLCEIATADHHFAPLECHAFQWGLESTLPDPDALPGQCVSALSRSAQYWSSYSGYLREVTQLCFAFQRWNDIDTAREVHRNATVASVAALRYLSEREKRMLHAWEESDTVIATMRAMLTQMQSYSTAIDIASVASSEKLSLTLSEMLGSFRGAMLDLQQRATHDHAIALSQMDANISHTLDQLAAVTDNLGPIIQDLLSLHFDRTFSSIASRLETLSQFAERAGHQFLKLESGFERLHHATIVLTANTRQAGADLEVRLGDSRVAHEKQLDIARISDNVSVTLSELVVKALVGMQDLNSTAAEIKDNLLKGPRSDRMATLWLWLQEVAVHILRVHPAHFDHPVYRALYASVRICRAVTVFASSVLMSTLVLLVSVKNTFLRRRRRMELHSDISILSDSQRSGPRVLDSVTLHPYLDLVKQGRPCELLLDSDFANFSAVSALRRSRASQIPDRLCRPR